MKNATLVIIRAGLYVWLGEKKEGSQMGVGKLNGPGGRFEKGESPIDCAIRETAEEFNITIRPNDLRFLGLLECCSGGKLFQIVYVFYTEMYFGQPIETESMLPQLFPVDRLPFDRMHEGDRHWFPRAANGEKLNVVRLWYELPGEGFIDHEFISLDE